MVFAFLSAAVSGVAQVASVAANAAGDVLARGDDTGKSIFSIAGAAFKSVGETIGGFSITGSDVATAPVSLGLLDRAKNFMGFSDGQNSGLVQQTIGQKCGRSAFVKTESPNTSEFDRSLADLCTLTAQADLPIVKGTFKGAAVGI